jgi:small redox-active disulfide protein 2
MEIKILGKGCPKCERLEKLAREVVSELGVEATFDHVRDMNAIVAYDIVSTPALVIDGQVKCYGRIPQKNEIAAWIQQAAA